MLFRFLPVKENSHSDELGSYISFGIKVIDSSDHEIVSVSDVSVDEAFVSEICRICTLYQLDPVHLRDVIDDLI